MASKAYSVVLRHEEKDIGSLRMGIGCSEVLIGRSKQCQLRTPSSDTSVSGVHARLYWKGRTLVVEDAGSRNGLFLRGTKLSRPHKIGAGDIFSIGACTLQCVEETTSRRTGAQNWHHLEYLNGDNAGRQVEIRPDSQTGVFTIGMDPGNSLCLPDMLVSRHHAEMSMREDGECWIRDLDSRNGTYVNGEVLHGRERLLIDNDKVSIAYFDFRFLDRKVSHKRLFLWLKMVSIVVTLCLMAGVYVMWVTTSATTEDYLRLARGHASNRDFVQARKTIESARTARDADHYKSQIEALSVQVDRWERTSSDWERAKALLARGALMDARKTLDPLTSGVTDVWLWNGTTAVEEKNDAEFAAKALRWYYDAEEVMQEAGEGQPEQQADKIRSCEDPLRDFVSESAAQFEAQPHLAPLTNEIAVVLAKMERIRAGFAAVDESISRLDSGKPDFARLARELDAIVKDKTLHGAVCAYADKYRQPCMELADAAQFIRKEFDDVNAMRFSAVRKRKDNLVLPNQGLCSRHPQLSKRRLNLELHHQDAQRMAENLEAMIGGLAEKGVVGGDCDKHLKHVLSIDSWRKALLFDCFDEKPPVTRRSSPSGFYDELLGVDYTFQSLRALPSNYNEWCLRLIKFSPDVVEARKALEYVNTFVKFIEDRPSWLRRGELGAFYKYCIGLQNKRAEVMNFLVNYSGSPRACVVAGFYSGYFSPDFDREKREALAAAFKKIQREVAELSDKYADTSDPVQQVSLRAKILEVGFPGDAQLHSKWVQRSSGGGK